MTTAIYMPTPEATIENTHIGDAVEQKEADGHLWAVHAIQSDPVTVYPVMVSCHRFENGAIVSDIFALDSLTNDSARVRAQEAASVLEDDPSPALAEGPDEDGCCPSCGHPADGSSGHGSCGHPCHRS